MDKVLQYLIDHPGWHHGLDLVKAGVASRSTVYVHLSRLLDDGFVEQRDSPEPPLTDGLKRRQYRATGKRIEIGTLGGSPVFG